MKVVLKKSLGFADIVVYDNDIFHLHVLSKVPLSVNQTIEINEVRVASLRNRKALVLTTGEDSFVTPSQEAVEYILSSDRNLSVKATAFVIKSFSQRLAILSAYNLKEMTNPIAYFATEKEAIEWLLKLED